MDAREVGIFDTLITAKSQSVKIYNFKLNEYFKKLMGNTFRTCPVNTVTCCFCTVELFCHHWSIWDQGLPKLLLTYKYCDLRAVPETNSSGEGGWWPLGWKCFDGRRAALDFGPPPSASSHFLLWGTAQKWSPYRGALLSTEGPLYGLSTEGPLYGLSTEGFLYGLSTKGPLYGLSTEGFLYGFSTKRFLYGHTREGFLSRGTSLQKGCSEEEPLYRGESTL